MSRTCTYTARTLTRLPRLTTLRPHHRRHLATASPSAFDGFAERTADCLIDLSPGADYTKYTRPHPPLTDSKPDVAAYLSLFGRPPGTPPDAESTPEHVEVGRAYLAEAFTRREGLFLDPALLPADTASLPLASHTLPHPGHQGCRPAHDKQYMAWASLVGLVADPKHQAPGVLKDRWAENLSSSKGWKLRGLTPFILGWEAPDTLGRGGGGDETVFPHVLSAYATLIVKTNIRAPLPYDLENINLAVVRELYSDTFNVVYQAFHSPDTTYLQLVRRALMGVPGYSPDLGEPGGEDRSKRFLVGEWAKEGLDGFEGFHE